MTQPIPTQCQSAIPPIIDGASDSTALALEWKKRAERAEAELTKHMPGAWVCDKCGFTLQKNILHALDGSISADDSPLNERCPNDNILMRSLTWREVNEDLFKRAMQELKRTERAEADLKMLRATHDAVKAVGNEMLKNYQCAVSELERVKRREAAIRSAMEWLLHVVDKDALNAIHKGAYIRLRDWLDRSDSGSDFIPRSEVQDILIDCLVVIAHGDGAAQISARRAVERAHAKGWCK